MPPTVGFTLTFAPEALDHIRAIERKYHAMLRDTINEQLRATPSIPTRNRKPLEQPAPFDATWELRCGPNNRFRVLYEVDEGERTVWILAIGVKEGNKLFIGGKEVEP